MMTDIMKVTQQGPLMVVAVIEMKVMAKVESDSMGLDTQDYCNDLPVFFSKSLVFHFRLPRFTS